MKKNKMMRIASVLLVAVLLTTSIISGTFAKYVTEGSASDEARVAKFGVLVTATGDLFDKTYKKTTDNTPGGSVWDENLEGTPKDLTALTVESNTNVVAPGTQSTGTGLTFGVTGTPEVDVNVKLDFTAVKDVFLAANATLPDMTKAGYTGTFNNDGEYHPIVFTLAGNYLKNADLGTINGLDTTKKASDGIVSGTLAQIKSVFDALNKGGNGIYVDANTDLATAIGSFNLTWKWQFEDDAAAQLATLKADVTQAEQALEQAKTDAPEGDHSTEEGNLTTAKAALAAAEAKVLLRDQKDTLLGDIAAGVVIEKTTEEATGKIQLPENYTLANNSYSTNVSVALTITVTQVD